MDKKIILASRSPRRSQLLKWAEVDFEILVQDTDESYPEGLSFEDAAIHIAHNKAIAIRSLSANDNIILAADTIVVCDKKMIGKPRDRNHAIEILHFLSGKTHQVITGVVLVKVDNTVSFADVTEVEFYPLTAEQIEYYVDYYKPYDKAGAYAIQEWIGVVGIKSIRGDFYNVMGLPVSRVVKALDEMH